MIVHRVAEHFMKFVRKFSVWSLPARHWWRGQERHSHARFFPAMCEMVEAAGVEGIRNFAAVRGGA